MHCSKNVDEIPGVNFNNVPQAASTHADPKSAKKTVMLLSICLALLGSAGVKAALRTLMKLTPGNSRCAFAVTGSSLMKTTWLKRWMGSGCP